MLLHRSDLRPSQFETYLDSLSTKRKCEVTCRLTLITVFMLSFTSRGWCIFVKEKRFTSQWPEPLALSHIHRKGYCFRAFLNNFN